jgi:hypothetical protein
VQRQKLILLSAILGLAFGALAVPTAAQSQAQTNRGQLNANLLTESQVR